MDFRAQLIEIKQFLHAGKIQEAMNRVQEIINYIDTSSDLATDITYTPSGLKAQAQAQAQRPIPALTHEYDSFRHSARLLHYLHRLELCVIKLESRARS